MVEEPPMAQALGAAWLEQALALVWVVVLAAKVQQLEAGSEGTPLEEQLVQLLAVVRLEKILQLLAGLAL